MHELLTTEEMAEADRRAVALGVPSLTLMENAGRTVADEAAKMVAPGAKIAVLCGPGNNGGDGFVAARLLRQRGFDVRVACLVSVDQLKGDATVMAGRWGGVTEALTPTVLTGASLIIDAIFGAGLSREVDGVVAQTIRAINCRNDGISALSVDVPSGLSGNSGQSLGDVVRADRTVTFFCKKTGHVLYPGRALCGQLVVADIGIPTDVLRFIHAQTVLNELFASGPPPLDVAAHKYTRGHAVVVSGPSHSTGAARLAARGALRIGAGLVTVASSPPALLVNAAHLTAMMLAPFVDARDLAEILEDKRKNAVLIGPGAGVDENTRDLTLAVLASGAAVVLDADALSSFAPGGGEEPAIVNFGFTSSRTKSIGTPAALFEAARAKPDRAVVMTPHEGEFKRLFPGLSALPSKLERARNAARISGAIVVLKGPDTVIAQPDGFAAINANAPPTLATAGSGDVLAGFITGLLAQGMPAFHAACAAVWLHGECANVFGPGLIAEDLPEVLPKVLASLNALREPGRQ
jgi:ADP-dependent NAD(P)H-hydrate dehydratase / NAD(P)H-hydrate epimerase